MKRTKGSHSIVAWILEVSILIGLPILLHFMVPVLILIQWPFTYLGAVLMIFALVLMTRTSTLFRKAGNSFGVGEGGSVLITSGPFRYSRNPILSEYANVAYRPGHAAWIIDLVSVPVTFIPTTNFFVIPREEKDLENKLGEQYLEYGRCVRRWI